MKRYAILLALALSLLMVQAAAANLVVNGGFELPGPGSFSGWTQSGDTSATGVNITYPHSGSYAAFFGPPNAMGYITQDIPTTAGASYDLSFWLASSAGKSTFVADWDGGNLVTLNSPGAFGYTNYTFTVTASTTSTPLDFGFYQFVLYWHIDDISVTANPVPIPGAVVLLGSGLLPLLGWRRFKNS